MAFVIFKTVNSKNKIFKQKNTNCLRKVKFYDNQIKPKLDNLRIMMNNLRINEGIEADALLWNKM